MSDDLRTRIAAVQLHHYPVECAGYLRCGCGAKFVPWSGAKAAWGNHLADAVIRELERQPPGLQRDGSFIDATGVVWRHTGKDWTNDQTYRP